MFGRAWLNHDRHRAARCRRRLGRGLLIVPPVAIVLAVLVAPIVLIALYSVDVGTNLPFTPTKFTWSMWKDFLPPSRASTRTRSSIGSRSRW